MIRLGIPVVPVLHLIALISLLHFLAIGAETLEAQGFLNEWREGQEINYEAFERVPARHWGSDDLQEPLRGIDRMLRDGGAAAAEVDNDR